MFGDKMAKVAKAIEKKNEGQLLKLMDTKDKNVKIAAMKGLGKVGSDDGFNALIPLLHNPDDDIRVAAAQALGEMGNGHAKAFISNQMAKEKNNSVKGAMAHALNLIKDYT